MARYSYVVKDEKGITSKGIVESVSAKHALGLLHKRNYFVVNLKEVRKIEISTKLKTISVGFGDIVNFTRQMASMITAGLTLLEALQILQNQISKPALVSLIKQLEDDVQGGTSFGDAISKYPRMFPPLYIALVRAGEASGKMDVILTKLADNLEKSREFRSKLRSAMIYPAIVVIAMVAVGIIVMTVVFPKLTALYKEMDIDLPLPTKILIAASDFTLKWQWVMILVPVLLFFMYYKFTHTRYGKRFIDRLLISLPGIGYLLQESAMVDMIRSLSILIDSGVPILTAIDISKNATSNSLYHEAFEEASKKVEKGVSLSEAISGNELFLPIITQMIAVGEQTGRLGECLYRLSQYFERETDTAIRSLTTIIEPLIMVILGIGVGFLVIAVLMPIYSLTTKF